MTMPTWRDIQSFAEAHGVSHPRSDGMQFDIVFVLSVGMVNFPNFVYACEINVL